MKYQHFSKLQSGKLVHQLLGGITFTYDICLGHSRDCWKGLIVQKKSEMGLKHRFWYNVPYTWSYTMIWKQFCEPQSVKLPCQLPSIVTFLYDVHLGHLRNHWKGLTEE